MRLRRLFMRGRYSLFIIITFSLFAFTSIRFIWHIRSPYSDEISGLSGQLFMKQLQPSDQPQPLPNHNSIINLPGADRLMNDTRDSWTEKLRAFIEEKNTVQLVRNEIKFGRLPSPHEPDLIGAPASALVIQLHDRLDNLQLLIKSLERVKGINSSLLVFSTDFISEPIIDLINTIDFARTIQIYYPHGMQIFADEFPGQEQTINPHRTTIDKSASHGRDKYGHERNASFVQVKHHWLWKMNFVFNHLVALKHYTRNVIFLEEDHFVVEDILHVQKLVEEHWEPTSTRALLALGSYTQFDPARSNEVREADWVSSRHNMGYGVSREMWKTIVPCLEVFCNYDDYNWDWSLQHTGRVCVENKLKALELYQGTRVYHLGKCTGLHHKSQNCSPYELAARLQQILSGPMLASLYPKQMIFPPVIRHFAKFRENGGWGDERDRALCRSMATSNWESILRQHYPLLTAIPPVH